MLILSCANKYANLDKEDKQRLDEIIYIASKDEINEYLNTPKEKRQEWLERFWKRRDPTPTTEKNERKIEHYKRIKYANEHFTLKSANIAGWKTDIGRIYIKYGPPDKVENAEIGLKQTWIYFSPALRYRFDEFGRIIHPFPGDQEYEVFHGATFPGLYALMAVAHMEKYGTTREMLSAVAVKNHHNGSMNPYAQYPFKVTREQVEESVMVASPLRILDCSPITDGGAAVILTTVDIAKKLGKPIIKIIGSGHATDTIALHSRDDLTTIKATTIAAQKALKMADKTIKDIDFAEVHDCFTIAEICAIEDLGFCKKGEGGLLTEEGETQIGGRIPVNPSGGLKACGHPVGATGIKQLVEATLQLRGEAEKRQVDGAEVALTHNVGGSGGTAVVHIFGKE